MYAELLRGLFTEESLTTAERKIDYLRGLQLRVKFLRKAYTKYPVPPNIYVERGVQAAYLLAYLPHYTEPLYEIFVRNAGIEIPTRLSLFGTGPCPEMIGLLRYIRDKHPRHAEPLRVTAYDLAHEEWAWSRSIVFNYVAPTFLRQNEFKVAGKRLDIAAPFDLGNVGRQFCVFQNCLNEIQPTSWPTFIASVIGLYKNLAPASWLCMIHAGQVERQLVRVEDLMGEIQNKIAAQYSTDAIVKDVAEGNEQGLIRHRSRFGYPPLEITQHLLTTLPGPPGTANGDPQLLPKRNLPFRYSLIRKV